MALLAQLPTVAPVDRLMSVQRDPLGVGSRLADLLGDTTSVLQLNDRRAAAALILRGGRDAGDEGMVLQEVGDGAAQLPGAVTVDDAQLAVIRDGRLVHELVKTVQRFVHRAADDVQFGEGSLPRGQIDADVNPARTRSGGTASCIPGSFPGRTASAEG